MRLLLDTHVVLWWQDDDARLRARTRRLIARAQKSYVSAASAWEFAIKQNVGRFRSKYPFAELFEKYEFSALDVTCAHAKRVADLPRHHGDPFDRMLVAQAQIEGLTLVTHDRKLEAYRVTIEWA